MKTDIRDVEAVRVIRPLEVVAYLRSNGWAQHAITSKSSVWTHAIGDDQFEILVPLDQAIRDYALRMGDLLHTLAAAENRSQEQVYADLLTTFADVVRIRIDDPELKDGTLPIEANAQIAQKARDLLLAAACSATELRPVWHTKKPQQAIDQVRKIRVGQSERGSYIVTVISKVSPALQVPPGGKLFDAVTPFDRRVIQMLASSLESLDQAAATAAMSGDFASFEASVANGVSANLCDAVTGLWGDDNEQRNIEFTFSWSPIRPIDPLVPSRVKFAPDRIPFIREASRLMKDRAPIYDYELEGAVIRLDRTPDQPVGRVTVFGQVGGKPKRVVMELSDPDYHLAVTAHDQEKAIRCLGSLVREGRGYALQNPREVAIEED